jgi:hypothetical protein
MTVFTTTTVCDAPECESRINVRLKTPDGAGELMFCGYHYRRFLPDLKAWRVTFAPPDLG